MRTGALQAEFYSENRVPRAGRLARWPARWRHERPWDASPRLHTATCSF